MPMERSGAATFKGAPKTVIGPELKAGDTAPDFEVLAKDLSTVTLQTSAGKTRLFSVVPSLDTGICAMQAKRFNEEAAKLPEDVVVYVVSADLPFAQNRFCGAENTNKITTLSDHRAMNFGDAWGVHIKELRLLQRSIFVVDKDGKVRYAEYVKEVASHPDYDKAMAALKQTMGA